MTVVESWVLSVNAVLFCNLTLSFPAVISPSRTRERTYARVGAVLFCRYVGT